MPQHVSVRYTSEIPGLRENSGRLVTPELLSAQAGSVGIPGIISRRDFLHSAAIGLGIGSQLFGADGITRNGKPFFKLSLAAYSFRNQLARNWPSLLGKTAELTLFDFIDFCANQNLDGVELTSYYFPNPLTTEYLNKIKEHTFRLGLGISGTAIGNNFCLTPGPARDAQLKLCRQWIDFAATMGAPVIRIFAGNIGTDQLEGQALDLCVEGIDESLKYAAEKGVVLALENHGGITSTPAQLLKIVERVQPSKWFGVNFDSGNFHTEDPYADLEQIAPYAVNAQVKASISPRGQPAQPADYKRIIEILKRAGYRGYLVLEYEEKEDPRQAVPAHLRQLRELIST